MKIVKDSSGDIWIKDYEGRWHVFFHNLPGVKSGPHSNPELLPLVDDIILYNTED